MCAVCGMLYCPVNCPAYEPARDPRVYGYCEECGVPLYAQGYTVCERCEDARDVKGEE